MAVASPYSLRLLGEQSTGRLTMADQLEVYNQVLQQIDHRADIGEVLRILEQLEKLQESA